MRFVVENARRIAPGVNPDALQATFARERVGSIADARARVRELLARDRAMPDFCAFTAGYNFGYLHAARERLKEHMGR